MNLLHGLFVVVFLVTCCATEKTANKVGKWAVKEYNKHAGSDAFVFQEVIRKINRKTSNGTVYGIYLTVGLNQLKWNLTAVSIVQKQNGTYKLLSFGEEDEDMKNDLEKNRSLLGIFKLLSKLFHHSNNSMKAKAKVDTKVNGQLNLSHNVNEGFNLEHNGGFQTHFSNQAQFNGGIEAGGSGQANAQSGFNSQAEFNAGSQFDMGASDYGMSDAELQGNANQAMMASSQGSNNMGYDGYNLQQQNNLNNNVNGYGQKANPNVAYLQY